MVYNTLIHKKKLMTKTPSIEAQAVIDAFDTEYYKNAKNRCNALSAVLRSVVQNCSGVDYDGGKRIATVLCADILDIADELDGMVEE
jgi:hypothetical protein